MLANRPFWKKVADPRELKDLSEHLGLVSQLGLTMVAAIGIALAVGHGLDRWLGTGGLWKALFIPVGVLSGGWAVYKAIASVGRRAEDRRR